MNRKLICILAFAVAVFPKNPALFPGMILRSEDGVRYHWECEFGVELSTKIVSENLVAETTGCKEQKKENGVILNLPTNQMKFVPPW